MSAAMLREFEKLEKAPKAPKSATNVCEKADGSEAQSIYKVGSAVMIPRVYFPCVFVPGAEYKRAFVRVRTSREEFITRCVPCQIAPGTCSLFKLFEDKFQYKTVSLDYEFEDPEVAPIRVCALRNPSTRRPISAYLRDLFAGGVYHDGQVVPECVNGEMVDFAVRCAGVCVMDADNFVYEGFREPESEEVDETTEVAETHAVVREQEEQTLNKRFSGFNEDLVDLARQITAKIAEGVAKPACALLHGPPGHGKSTFYARLKAANPSVLSLSLDAKTALAQLADVRFERSLAFLDEIDELNAETQAALALALTQLGKHVFFLAATNRPQDLDRRLFSTFDRQIEVKQNHKAKRAMIASLLCPDDAEAAFEKCAQFSPADIALLLQNAGGHDGFNTARLEQQIRVYQPSNFRNLQMQAPAMVYGHANAIACIQASIEHGEHQAFLLTGPPGCGKNQIIKYFALNNIKIPVSSAGEVIGPYVGESEKQLFALFKEATSATPSVLFFDEIDGLFADREAHTRRLWTTFREMLRKRALTLIMASNKPWILPAELLAHCRPLYIGELTRSEAAAMLQGQFQALGADFALEDAVIDRLGGVCEGCSGASVQQCIVAAKRAFLAAKLAGRSFSDVEQFFTGVQRIDPVVAAKYREFIASE